MILNKSFQRPFPIAFSLLGAVFAATAAWGDPCGMVPPVYVGDEAPIARVGEQKTYVFYKDGVETFVIHPGFEGKVDEFGMLIPFPTVPAIRKVPDATFAHIAAAVDPPEVVVDLSPPMPMAAAAPSGPGGGGGYAITGGALRFDEVRVVREEAVGMYEVAVLAAGGAAGLKRWMDDHGYQYPAGMDVACNDYVRRKWCFVAVKTKVGDKRGVDPRPGMRAADSKLPDGAVFDGRVQAMGFRFKSDELVVPMRLSTFNEGELRNIVYVVADGPRKIRSVPEEYVVRQLTGEELHRNVTEPLPVRIVGGDASRPIDHWRKDRITKSRNPVPKNGIARDLFASDLLAAGEKRLAHPHEEEEKMLLRIGEALSLRGPEIDRLNEEAGKAERERIVKQSLDGLKQMTLTVVDGHFPRKVLAEQNLAFVDYQMAERLNSAAHYDARRNGPGASRDGVLRRGALKFEKPPKQDDAPPAPANAAPPNDAPPAPPGAAASPILPRRGGMRGGLAIAFIALTATFGAVVFRRRLRLGSSVLRTCTCRRHGRH